MSQWLYFGLSATVLLAPFVYLAIRRWRANRRMREQLEEESCRICHFREVTTRASDDYCCERCGFDTRMMEDPEIAALVENLRDVRLAFDEFEEATKLMARAEVEGDMWSDAVPHDYIQRAGRRQIDGLEHLKGVLAADSSLLEMPIAGAEVTTTALKDLFVDLPGRDLRRSRQVAKSREDVQAYLRKVAVLQRAAMTRVLRAISRRDVIPDPAEDG